jgi:8-oxo-dGTP pyrophosphatase MutT (NUDIX family)
MSVLAQESGDVLSRYHFSPGHFTASGFVISEDRSGLLLILHERLGKWLQPGGHIEPEDVDIEGAVRREITEETGLTDLAPVGVGLFDIDVHEIPAARGEPHHEHHDLRFLYTARGRAFAGDGAADVAWVPLDQLPSLTTDRSVLRAAVKLEAGSRGSGSQA